MNYYVTTNKLQLNYSVRLLWAAASWARLVVHSNPNSNYSHFKFPLNARRINFFCTDGFLYILHGNLRGQGKAEAGQVRKLEAMH